MAIPSVSPMPTGGSSASGSRGAGFASSLDLKSILELISPFIKDAAEPAKPIQTQEARHSATIPFAPPVFPMASRDYAGGGGKGLLSALLKKGSSK